MESGKVTGANVSVKLTDDFMKAVEEKASFRQQYPIISQNPKYVNNVDAVQLWNKIIHNAWKSAEPGVLFWDTIIRESVPDCYSDLGFATVSTNPCGEIPLCPYDSCRLLAINLYSYVKNPFTKKAEFDFELYKEHIGVDFINYSVNFFHFEVNNIVHYPLGNSDMFFVEFKIEFGFFREWIFNVTIKIYGK
jgi:ribonucleoside-diphosphate reductase alpha chain